MNFDWTECGIEGTVQNGQIIESHWYRLDAQSFIPVKVYDEVPVDTVLFLKKDCMEMK